MVQTTLVRETHTCYRVSIDQFGIMRVSDQVLRFTGFVSRKYDALISMVTRGGIQRGVAPIFVIISYYVLSVDGWRGQEVSGRRLLDGNQVVIHWGWGHLGPRYRGERERGGGSHLL